MEGFLFNLPKLELHAHLNGSLSINSIRELGQCLYGSNSKEFLDLCQRFVNFNGVDFSGCFQKFKFMHELTATKEGLALATQLVIRDFERENVRYLELRSTPKANEYMTKREYLECVISAIITAREHYRSIQVKLLPSIDRSQSVKSAVETLDIVIGLREAFDDIITGIDLSGDPHRGKFSDFKEVLAKARSHGLKLTLHCAETDNPSDIEEMINFGMDRCGHGTYLSKSQLDKLSQLDIPIECCLTSNVKCATVASYDDHHFKQIFNSNNAVVLCTDDCGVFDVTLTQEFLIAAQHYNLRKEDFLRLSLNAVEYAFTDEASKQELCRLISEYYKSHSD